MIKTLQAEIMEQFSAAGVDFDREKQGICLLSLGKDSLLRVLK